MCSTQQEVKKHPLRDAEFISFYHGSMQLFKKDYDSHQLVGRKFTNLTKVIKDALWTQQMNGFQELLKNDQTLIQRRFLGMPSKLFLKRLFMVVRLIMNLIKRFLILQLSTFLHPKHLRQTLNCLDGQKVLRLKSSLFLLKENFRISSNGQRNYQSLKVLYGQDYL